MIYFISRNSETTCSANGFHSDRKNILEFQDGPCTKTFESVDPDSFSNLNITSCFIRRKYRRKIGRYLHGDPGNPGKP